MKRRLPTNWPWLGLVASAFLVGWAMEPAWSPPPAVTAAATDRWSLPGQTAEPVPASALVMAIGAPMWGRPMGPAAGAPATAAVAASAHTWRVAGIFGTTAQRQVLIRYANDEKPAAYLKVGDRLPSGETLVAIGDRQLQLRRGRKTLEQAVERAEP